MRIIIGYRHFPAADLLDYLGGAVIRYAGKSVVPVSCLCFSGWLCAAGMLFIIQLEQLCQRFHRCSRHRELRERHRRCHLLPLDAVIFLIDNTLQLPVDVPDRISPAGCPAGVFGRWRPLDKSVSKINAAAVQSLPDSRIDRGLRLHISKHRAHSFLAPSPRHQIIKYVLRVACHLRHRKVGITADYRHNLLLCLSKTTILRISTDYDSVF